LSQACGPTNEDVQKELLLMVEISNVMNALVFALLGVVIFGVSFLLIDLVTPYKLWKEIIDEHNSALAIIVGAMSLGICIIIAAAIHG